MKMKKVCTSMLAIMLLLSVLQLTVGVTFAHCMHSGRDFMVSPMELAGRAHTMMQTDEGCATMSCPSMEQQQCMEYSVKHLSASVQAPAPDYDLAAVQPVLFNLWSLLVPMAACSVMRQDVFCPDKVPIPPRAYLAKIRILLI